MGALLGLLKNYAIEDDQHFHEQISKLIKDGADPNQTFTNDILIKDYPDDLDIDGLLVKAGTSFIDAYLLLIKHQSYYNENRQNIIDLSFSHGAIKDKPSTLQIIVQWRDFNLFIKATSPAAIEHKLTIFLKMVLDAYPKSNITLRNFDNLNINWADFFKLIAASPEKNNLMNLLVNTFIEYQFTVNTDKNFIHNLAAYMHKDKDVAKQVCDIMLRLNQILLYQELLEINHGVALTAYIKFKTENAKFNQKLVYDINQKSFFFTPNPYQKVELKDFYQIFGLDSNSISELHAFIILLILSSLKTLHEDFVLKMQETLYNVPGFKEHIVYRNLFMDAWRLLNKILATSSVTEDDNSLGWFLGLAANTIGIQALGHKLFNDHKFRSQALPDLIRMKKIEIYPMGRSINTWHELCSAIVKTQHSILTDIWQKNAALPTTAANQTTDNLYFSCNAVNFIHAQGRTLLFNNGFGKIFALKVCKTNEPVADLHKQSTTVDMLNANAANWGLLSELPLSHGVVKINKFENFLGNNTNLTTAQIKCFLELVQADTTGAVHAYQYTAPNDYFIYLHDANLTLRDFSRASLIAINDLLILLNNGIVFDRLADLFHADCRFFTCFITYGLGCAGRLADWKGAVEYLNIRKSGLADEGDWVPRSSLINKESTASGYTKLSYIDPVNLHKNIVNYLSEILLVIELSAGYRTIKIFERDNINQDQKDLAWDDVAKALDTIYKLMFSMLCDKFAVGNQAHIFNLLYDKNRTAKNIGFWFDKTRNAAACIQGKIPDEVYYPGTIVEVDLADEVAHGAFSAEHGAYVDKHECLGVFNGCYPIDDRMHFLVPTIPMWIFVSKKYQEQQLSQIQQNIKSGNLELALVNYNADAPYAKCKEASDTRFSLFKLYNQKRLADDAKVSTVQHPIADLAANTVRAFYKARHT